MHGTANDVGILDQQIPMGNGRQTLAKSNEFLFRRESHSGQKHLRKCTGSLSRTKGAASMHPHTLPRDQRGPLDHHHQEESK